MCLCAVCLLGPFYSAACAPWWGLCSSCAASPCSSHRSRCQAFTYSVQQRYLNTHSLTHSRCQAFTYSVQQRYLDTHLLTHITALSKATWTAHKYLYQCSVDKWPLVDIWRIPGKHKYPTVLPSEAFWGINNKCVLDWKWRLIKPVYQFVHRGQ